MKIDRRSIVTFIFLGSALGGILGLAWLGPKRPPAVRLLVSLPEASLTRLGISGNGGQASLERQDGPWQFVQPVQDLADSQRMRDLTTGLCRLPVREFIQPGTIKDSILGLSPSRAIHVELGTGSPSKNGLVEHLLIGRPGAFEGTVYARLEDRPDRHGVHLVETPARPALAAPVEQLRERRIFTFPATAVRSYTLKCGNLDLELVRAETEPRWFLNRPIQCRANDDIAYSILEELAGMRAEHFLDDRVLPAGTRMEESAAAFLIHPEQGDPVRLIVEPKTGKGQGPASMLVHVAGRSTTLEILDDLVSRLPRNLDQLRYPYLIEFRKDTVARILIESRDDPDVQLTSDGRRWNLVSGGSSRPANDDRIKAMLADLLAEPVLEFRSNSLADLGRFGLDRPALRLSIVTSSIDAEVYDAYQKELAKARFEGREASSVPVPEVQVEQQVLAFSPGPDGLLNVNPVGTPFIYAIDPALLSSSLPTHPLKWRDLEVLSFSLFEVRGIGIEQAGLPAVNLDYDYLQNQWSATAGGSPLPEGTVDMRRAELLASTLGNLRARDFLTSRADAYQALRNPSCVVRLRTAERPGEAALERVLLLAAAVQGTNVEFYYGQFEGEPDVFVLDSDIYDRIVAPVLRPRPR